MIYLFNNNEEMIKIVPKTAIRSMYQSQTLTDENYISDRLDVELKALDEELLNEIEYMAIDDVENPQRFHFYFIATETTENNITKLVGVQSGIEELRKTPVYDIRPNNQTPSQIINRLLEGTNWQAGFTTNEAGTLSTNFYYTDVFSALKKMCQGFGIEMQFFVEITGNRLGARYIEFRKKIGKSIGKRVVYGHNALKVIKEVEKTETITALIGRGKGVEVSSAEDNEGGQAGYGRKIGFENVEWRITSGAPVDKPKGQEYLEIPALTLRYGIKNSNGTVRPKIGFIEFQDEEDPNRLIDRTYEVLLELGRPQVLLQTSSTYLPDTGIGDTVNVVRHDRNLRYQTRVFEIKYDRLANRAVEMKLGDKLNESESKRLSKITNQVSGSINEGLGSTINIILDRLTTADGKNTNWYTSYDPATNPETMGLVRVNDNWYAPDPEYEGEYILYRWDGEMWIEILRTSGMYILEEALRQAEELAEQLREEIEESERKALEAIGKAEESLEEIGRIDTTIDDLRGDLNTVGDRATSSLEIIGLDGGAMYNKNRRLGAKSQAIQPDSKAFISHNGSGFELGETYTLSFKVSCLLDDVVTWEERTRTQSVPFVREITYNTNLTPEESYIERAGINGTATYTWQVELVNGVLTGNKTNEVRTAYTAPVNELFIQGTKQESKLTINFTADEVIPVMPRSESQVILNFIEPGGSLPPDPVEPVEPGESQFTNARVVNLADYGGVGDASTDNFNALKSVIAASVNEPLVLEIDAGNYYVEGETNQRLEPWPNESKGLRIVGKGNVNIYHKNNRATNRHEYYLMQMIMSADSLGFEVENITVDGIRNPQEELFYTHSESNPIPNIPMTRGFAVHGAHNVMFNNVRFKNMYGGYAILAEEYRTVNITNTTFDKVGGNDQQESFGMAIYLGGHRGNAVINIDNVHAQGMTTTKDLRLSWIGVVLENGSIQSNDSSVWLRDVNTTVNITNSSFLDYHSTFHVESIAGNVYWNVDNVDARGSNYQIVAGVYGEYKESTNDLRFDMLPYGRLWGIVKGLYYSEAQEAEDNWNGHNTMNMYNSIINFIKVPGFDDPPQAIAYGSNVTGRLHNTQLNNVPHKLVTNGSALLYDSEVNLAQGSQETRQTLMNGNFSDTNKQRVQFNNTNVNAYGSHRQVQFGNKPVFVQNEGFVPPFIDLPIQPPI